MFGNKIKSTQDAFAFFDNIEKSAGGDGLIWARSSAPEGREVIVHLELQNGRVIFLPPITAGVPVHLTEWATLANFRDNSNLGMAAAKGLVKLMTTGEAKIYIENRAEILKESPEEMLEKAAQQSRDTVSGKKIAQAASEPLRAESVDSLEDILLPKVLYLADQVAVTLKDHEKMPVKEFLTQLMNMQDYLDITNLEYLKSRCFYPSARKFIEKLITIKATEQGLFPQTDELSDK